MNRIVPLLALAAVMMWSVSGAVSGRAALSNRAQLEAASKSHLKAGEQSSDAQQALLEKRQARQARIDRRNERRERKRLRAAQREGQKLQAESAVDFETVADAEEFNRLDAKADLNKASKFGLQIMSENLHRENAALSSSSGAKASSGTRFAQQESIDAEVMSEQEAANEAELHDENLLSAAGESEDLFNAKEGLRQESEVYIDAQDQAHQRGGFVQENDFFEGSSFGNNGFGSGGLFGSSLFRK